MDEALDVIVRHASRFTELLASVDDGARRIPSLVWTVGDLGAHVAAGTPAYRKMVEGGCHPWPDLENGPVHNTAIIETVSERNPRRLAGEIEAEVSALVDAFRCCVGGSITWAGGIQVSPSSVAAICAGEFLVHGWDLARALRRKWDIPAADAIVTLRGLCEVMPHFVDQQAAAEFSGTFQVELRGGPTMSMTFDRGVLTIREGRADRADCRISVDPAAFILISYGRLPLWQPAITGKMIAYGRKPWRSLKMTSLMRQP